MSEQVDLKACHRCESVDVLRWKDGGISCAESDCFADAKSIEDWNTRSLEDALQAKLDRAIETLTNLNVIASDMPKSQIKLIIIRVIAELEASDDM